MRLGIIAASFKQPNVQTVITKPIAVNMYTIVVVQKANKYKVLWQ